MPDWRFPSPAEAREFATLLTRLCEAERRRAALWDRYAGSDWEDLLAPDDRDDKPPPSEAELEAADHAVAVLKGELSRRLESPDFAAPFGWSDDFISAVAEERASLLRDQRAPGVFPYPTAQDEGGKSRLVFEPPPAFIQELIQRAMRAKAIAQDIDRERLRELRDEIERRKRKRNAPASIPEAVAAPADAQAAPEPTAKPKRRRGRRADPLVTEIGERWATGEYHDRYALLKAMNEERPDDAQLTKSQVDRAIASYSKHKRG